jgi:hypothetical protein
MTYSLDFRLKVLEIKKEEGLSLSGVAARFKISRNTVFKWSKNILCRAPRYKIHLDSIPPELLIHLSANLIDPIRGV